tara:strand:- start:222 stop:437 length:216 start_codon:yes stop_codon:yes gene_type:complete
MPLVKSVLKSKIKNALLSENGDDATQGQKEAAERLASKLSNAIDSYIRSATVSSTGANSGGPVISTSTGIS